MYLVIGAKEKGYWIAQVADKQILLNNLNNGYYKNKWVSQNGDLQFVEELPLTLEQCSTMNEFNPDEIMIVECKVVNPIPMQVTTQYALEED